MKVYLPDGLRNLSSGYISRSSCNRLYEISTKSLSVQTHESIYILTRWTCFPKRISACYKDKVKGLRRRYMRAL